MVLSDDARLEDPGFGAGNPGRVEFGWRCAALWRRGFFACRGVDRLGSGGTHVCSPYGVGRCCGVLCVLPGVQSVTHSTRLVTRTKEFMVCASHWVCRSLKA